MASKRVAADDPFANILEAVAEDQGAKRARPEENYFDYISKPIVSTSPRRRQSSAGSDRRHLPADQAMA